MTTKRVYTPTSGRRIYREGDPRDGEGRACQRAFFEDIALLVTDSGRTVRGYVPGRRRSAEALYAAVTIGDANDPVVEYYRAVREAFIAMADWEIRTDVATGQPYTRSPERLADHSRNLEHLDRTQSADITPFENAVSAVGTAAVLLTPSEAHDTVESIAIGTSATSDEFRAEFDLFFEIPALE